MVSTFSLSFSALKSTFGQINGFHFFPSVAQYFRSLCWQDTVLLCTFPLHLDKFDNGNWAMSTLGSWFTKKIGDRDIFGNSSILTIIFVFLSPLVGHCAPSAAKFDNGALSTLGSQYFLKMTSNRKITHLCKLQQPERHVLGSTNLTQSTTRWIWTSGSSWPTEYRSCCCCRSGGLSRSQCHTCQIRCIFNDSHQLIGTYFQDGHEQPKRLSFQIHGQEGPNSYRFGYDTGLG